MIAPRLFEAALLAIALSCVAGSMALAYAGHAVWAFAIAFAGIVVSVVGVVSHS